MSEINKEVEIKEALDKITDQVKEAGEKALAEAAKTGDMAKKNKESVDDLLIKFNGLQAEFRDIEQKKAANVGQELRQKSMGEQLSEYDRFKSFVLNEGARGQVSMQVKTVMSAQAGALIRPLYETEPVAIPKRRFTIRDLLNVVPIKTSSVDYPKQSVRTNNAAPVAEGAAKPYSDYAWTNATANIRVLAHLVKISRQAMDDAPRLVAEIDNEMRYGLQFVEEAQLLNGSGVGNNIAGILPQATAFAPPIVVAGATRIDNIRLAMLQTTLALYPADGIVMNEGDWAGIELQKTTQGEYLFSNPQGQVEPRLWGLPVVATPAMALDSFLVGSFRFGATLYDRMGIELLIATENDKDFENNMFTMRCEERIGLAVKRPASFVVGDFGFVA